ncbi:peptidase MA family metallohydrolase [Chloroflexota bacterium]
MLKRVFYTGLIVALTACLLPLAPEKEVSAREINYAVGGINCDTSVTAEFPLQLHFDLSAESDTEITEIRLHYATSRDSFIPVTSEAIVEFEPGTSVDVRWSWDMRRTGGLPPGTDIRYWWTVRDTDGKSTATETTTVSFDDNRHDWQSISEGNITIHWYKGDHTFAGNLMGASQQALDRLEEATGARLTRKAEIYIYADSRDLQGAMVFPQEWTGGAAYPQYGIIAIGIAPSNIQWGVRSIAHELTHLTVHQMTNNPYNDLPSWLEEGMAMFAEGDLERHFTIQIEDAISENRLISVRTLSSPFSPDTDKALLSYAQSYSLVEFLTGKYGQGKMLELLTAFSRGDSYPVILEKVYGTDMDELNEMWQDYITGQYREGKVSTTVSR